jgi:hypothetical protein
MSVLSCFVALEAATRRCPGARFVRDRRLAAAIMALALAAAATPPVWAAAPQNNPPPHGTATAVSTGPSELNPDGSVPDAVVKAGVETRAFRAWDCDQPNHAPVVWARADHGTISIKPITFSGPKCGRLSMTVAGIFYTSEPGFKGTDKIYVLGYLTNGRLDETLTILVK